MALHAWSNFRMSSIRCSVGSISLEEQKLALSEQMVCSRQPLEPTPNGIRTVLDFLSNPLKLWRSERPRRQKNGP